MIRAKVIPIIFLFIIGVLVYSNTLNSSFHFDDISFISENYSIRDVGNLRALWNYWPTRFTGIFSFALNYRLHQLNPFGYHLVNLLIHIFCSGMVFWLARLTFSVPEIERQEIAKNKNYIIFFASLIFLVHPVQTEAVNYVFQRVTLLAAFFYLASLCFYIKAVLFKRAKAGAVNFFYFLSLVAALAAMFSKEIAFTLPFAVLLYDACFLKTKRGINWEYIFPFFVLLPLIPATILITKPLVFMNVQKLFESPILNSTSYLFTQFRVLLTYIRLFVLPINQNLDYDYPVSVSLLEMPVFLSLVFLLFLLVAGIRAFSRFRLAAFGIFWFFIALFPESSIIPLTDVIYEHRLYLAMAGCSIAGVSGIYYIFSKKKSRFATALILSAVICYSALSYNRNLLWKDEFTLWNDTVKKSPNKLRPYNERGLSYLDRGDFDKAIADFTRAVSLNPAYADGYYNRGLGYFKKADHDKAIADFTQAIKLNGNFQKSYYNRGISYYIKKEYGLAAVDFEEALSVTPDFLEARTFLCSSYSLSGKSKEASECYEKSAELKKNNLFRLDKLAEAFIGEAKFKEAVEVYKKILEIEPDLAVAHNNLAVAYYYDRQYDLAIRHVDMAQKLGYKVTPKLLGLIEPHRKKD